MTNSHSFNTLIVLRSKIYLMRKLILTILLCTAVGVVGYAQNPVHWTYSAQKTANDEYEITLKANLDKGWCMYSQYLANDDGPVRTSVNFESNTNIQLLGKTEEDPKHRKEIDDQVFGMKLIKFYEEAIFKQHIKVKSGVKNINGVVTYMSCDNAMCLPPKDVRFSVTLP
jgi:Disulphide bond corrector protein DsbC